MHRTIAILFIFSSATMAQGVSARMGARAAALGQAGFILSDGSSLFQNASAQAFLEKPAFFFAYDRAPGLTGADRTAASIVVPSGWGVFSVGAFRFGDDIYSEQLLAAAFSHRLENTGLGVKGNLLQYRADGFGTRTAFTVDVSGLTRITPEWSVGAGIFNLNQAGITDNELLPVTLVAAVGWQPTSGPLLTLEAEKQTDAPLRVKGGVEIAIRDKVYLRSGFGLQPTTLAAGLGARSRRLQADFSTTYHLVFSFTYQASAVWSLGKK